MSLKRHTLNLLIILLVTSCGSDNKPDLVKFKSGLYGSRAGEFMAKFPAEPKVSSRHYELSPTLEFDEFVFRYKQGIEHTYNVSFVDFPDELVAQLDTEQLFDQTIQGISAEIDDFRITERKVNTEDSYDKSITYTLFSSTPGAMMKAKLLKQGKRIYNITFACSRKQPNTEDIDAFLNSFRIYKPQD